MRTLPPAVAALALMVLAACGPKPDRAELLKIWHSPTSPIAARLDAARKLVPPGTRLPAALVLLGTNGSRTETLYGSPPGPPNTNVGGAARSQRQLRIFEVYSFSDDGDIVLSLQEPYPPRWKQLKVSSIDWVPPLYIEVDPPAE